MFNYRNINIFFAVFIGGWVWLDHRYGFAPSAYAWILMAYIVVLFCGTYFIRLGFFFRSYCSGDRDKKEIALTFDDGPESLTTRVLGILKEKQVTAAFFCIGRKIPGREELLNQMIQEGHIIGNHSYSHHPLFDLFSPRRMQDELLQTNQLIEKATGFFPRFFRPPYGVTNPSLKKAIERSGMISIGWNLRSYDTAIHNEMRLKKRILDRVKAGTILLVHDTCETTVNLLPGLIDEIQQRGYRILRLDKMINLEPYV
ncbi:MAG TPA: polysaccharide deacetylase family protein [Puia sp.]|nr:polysaccharide deacetylase family protein [Puia sp.]